MPTGIYSRTPKIKIGRSKASCHPDRLVQAHGLCATCYRREYRKNNPAKTKKWWKISNRRRKGSGYAKKYYSQNKEKFRGLHLKYHFGISSEQYTEMFKKQNGACAICGKFSIELNLQIDHDHETGRIRELLCGKCNRALGLLHDDINIFSSAIKYIERWRT